MGAERRTIMCKRHITPPIQGDMLVNNPLSWYNLNELPALGPSWSLCGLYLLSFLQAIPTYKCYTHMPKQKRCDKNRDLCLAQILLYVHTSKTLINNSGHNTYRRLPTKAFTRKVLCCPRKFAFNSNLINKHT